jgi:hypothetical protein
LIHAVTILAHIIFVFDWVMVMEKTTAVSLQAPTRAAYVPLVNAFVKNASLAFGLDESRALELVLATEEIFTHLSQSAALSWTVDITCANGGYYVRVDFALPAKGINLRAFNLTSRVSLENDAGLDEMGLVLASRSVDRFQVSHETGPGLRLTLLKEKSYPLADANPLPLPPLLRPFLVRAPNVQETKLLVQYASQVCPPHLLPPFLHYPGQVVDMLAVGDYQAAVVVGAKGEIGGAILWHWVGEKTVECFGPYLFGPPAPDLSNALLEHGLGAIAKTRAVGLVNRMSTPDVPLEQFEPLGTLTAFHHDGTAHERTTYIRHLQEDEGSMIWAHPDLERFLRREYELHFMPRELVAVKDERETRAPFSVLSAEIERSQDQVTLRPIWTGRDAEENLGAHVELFRQEELLNIFFEMDLGQSWQADFTPALLKCGFTPRLVLPYAGKGDLVIFQRGGPAV